MTVENPTVVDAVAKGPDGRYLLVMTEDRFYAGGDTAAMVEQLRQKLNAYVHLVRSGQLEQMIGPDVRQAGVDVSLSCRDHPPLTVRELLEVAGRGLAADGIRVSYDLVAPPTAAEVYDAIGPMLIGAAPADWERIDLTATLVGDGLAGGLTATRADGGVTPLPPADWLIQAVQDLKRAIWQPQYGTFVTVRIEIAGTSLQPRFDYDEPPDGADGYTPEDWAEELRRYPRPVVPDWWRAQLERAR